MDFLNVSLHIYIKKKKKILVTDTTFYKFKFILQF